MENNDKGFNLLLPVCWSPPSAPWFLPRSLPASIVSLLPRASGTWAWLPSCLPSTHWLEWVFNNAICFVIFKLLKSCFYNQQITRMVWDCTDMKGTPFSSLLPPSPLGGARQFLSSEATTATSFLFLLLETRHACMSTGRHTSFVKITWHEASVTEVLQFSNRRPVFPVLLHSTEYWKYLCSRFWAGSMQVSWLQLKSFSI